ncbi:MAG: hydroxymethylglutaryl-CoA lyase, partial [Phycisphaerales bacterium]|nr:hydroxymethylglutaryl-CoA lyase [Phycisphaerales bacterium]
MTTASDSALSRPVRITDVAPRDGLQNEPRPIPTDDKLRLVELLCAAHVDEVEVTSFVSPRWIPQLGDADALFAALQGKKPRDVVFSALVPNEKGMQAALRVNEDAGERLIDKVSVFTAASETFSQRNTNATIAETLDRFKPVIESAKREGLLTRGYVSCAIACPFEGAIQPDAVANVAMALRDLGIDEIDLGDTIGAGARDSVARMLDAVIARAPLANAAIEAQTPTITLHLHDTFGRAGECVRVALERGLR